jgi:hypothetical protein
MYTRACYDACVRMCLFVNLRLKFEESTFLIVLRKDLYACSYMLNQALDTTA